MQPGSELGRDELLQRKRLERALTVELTTYLFEPAANDARDLLVTACNGEPIDLSEVQHAVENSPVGHVEHFGFGGFTCVLRRLRFLPERERRIVELRFGLKGSTATLAEIGLEMGISRERVRQLEGRALSSLRDQPGATGLLQSMDVSQSYS